MKNNLMQKNLHMQTLRKMALHVLFSKDNNEKAEVLIFRVGEIFKKGRMNKPLGGFHIGH